LTGTNGAETVPACAAGCLRRLTAIPLQEPLAPRRGGTFQIKWTAHFLIYGIGRGLILCLKHSRLAFKKRLFYDFLPELKISTNKQKARIFG